MPKRRLSNPNTTPLTKIKKLKLTTKGIDDEPWNLPKDQIKEVCSDLLSVVVDYKDKEYSWLM